MRKHCPFGPSPQELRKQADRKGKGSGKNCHVFTPKEQDARCPQVLSLMKSVNADCLQTDDTRFSWTMMATNGAASGSAANRPPAGSIQPFRDIRWPPGKTLIFRYKFIQQQLSGSHSRFFRYNYFPGRKGLTSSDVSDERQSGYTISQLQNYAR